MGRRRSARVHRPPARGRASGDHGPGARPSGGQRAASRRSAPGAAPRRSSSSRCPSTPMSRLLDGLVTDLPAPLRAELVQRAEGIPLYAVETVRALIDRDVAVPQDGRYVVDARSAAALDLAALGPPASLQALLAARLDALPDDERRIVQDASVLGMSFTRSGIESLTPDGVDLDVALDSLRRKEILTIDTDPRSPGARSVPLRAGAAARRRLRHAVASRPALPAPVGSGLSRRAAGRRRDRGHRRGALPRCVGVGSGRARRRRADCARDQPARAGGAARHRDRFACARRLPLLPTAVARPAR